MNEPLPIRPLAGPAEMQRAVDLQKIVWQPEDRDLVPVTEMVAASHNDGIVLGAFEGERLVGFTFSMVGARRGRVYQYSRMLAVDPACQGRGLGAALKLEQKRVALLRGYTWMEWTFDPLEARNAALNLRRLGARVRHYYRDFYGPRTSRYDLGVPTDRYRAEWDLAEDLDVSGPRRRSLHAAARPVFPVESRGGFPHPGRLDFRPAEAPAHRIPVPARFQPIREGSRETALAWRMAVREASEALFEAGLALVDCAGAGGEGDGLAAHVAAREADLEGVAP